MLINLHVKNIALIDEADVEFGPGLNILTGETGAGKSILIDSVNLALGAKLPKDRIRKGEESAFVQLLFSIDSEEKAEALRRMDVEPEEDAIIVSRKIYPGRSVCKINDETVTAGKLKEVTGLLLDIHGQHEHQSLLYENRHLEILDEFGKNILSDLKKKTEEAYKQWKKAKEALETFSLDEEGRLREIDFLEYEIREIDQAQLKPGEEEELSALYKKYVNSQRIAEGISAMESLLGYETGAGEQVSRAVREIAAVSSLDRGLSDLEKQMYDLESVLDGVNHSLSSYIESLSFDPEQFGQIESRLDRLRSLEAKYGPDYEAIMDNLKKKETRLQELRFYEERKKEAKERQNQAQKQLEALCSSLTEKRRETAVKLERKITEALRDLNFLDVKFAIHISSLSAPTSQGMDFVEFLISTNPGEPVKPLAKVASGGELSRIMLGIKAVLADMDHIPTLIFDEIDTGISGRTAQRVSEKLAYISKTHQVICITHLAQIAAMADCHFLIEKSVRGGMTSTRVETLTREGSIKELARILGGAEITGAVLDTAREMKELAERAKNC